ncbi:MAG: hypothetical protein ACFBRM_02470 [Pikeienuella sp.]
MTLTRVLEPVFWLTPEFIAAVGGGFAALMASFFTINLGLRLIPEGRAFLNEARARGVLIANPSRHSPRQVQAIFALAVVLAILAGLGTYRLMHSSLMGPRWPSPIRVAHVQGAQIDDRAGCPAGPHIFG